MTARLRTGTFKDAEDSNDSLVGGSPLTPLALMAEDKQRLSTDRVWARAFLLNVGLTLIAAVCFGRMAIVAVTSGTLTQAGRRQLLVAGEEDTLQPSFGGDGIGNYVFAGLLAAGIATISVILFGRALTCARGIMYLPFALFGSSMGLVAILLLVVRAKICAAFAGIVCAGVMLLVYKKKHRIELSAAHLKVSAEAVNSMPWLARSAGIVVMVQCLWVLVATIASLGAFVALESVTGPDDTSYLAINCVNPLASFMGEGSPMTGPLAAGATPPGPSCICSGQKISDEECEFSGFRIPFAVLGAISMFWGASVLQNIMTCTVSGAVSSWWFTPDRNSAPVKGAFYRATHSSFGTLCKAALVQNALGLVRLLGNVLRFLPGGCAFLMCLGDCAVQYVMSYAVCCVGIYGFNVKEAGRRVGQLFQGRAVTAIANDCILMLALQELIVLLSFAMGFVLGIVCAMTLISGTDTVETHIGPLIFGAMVIALPMASMAEMVRSGFKTVFVCFVHHPEALARNHDQRLHEGLNAAWNEINARSNQVVVGQNAHPYASASVV